MVIRSVHTKAFVALETCPRERDMALRETTEQTVDRGAAYTRAWWSEVKETARSRGHQNTVDNSEDERITGDGREIMKTK
jgi:hypothetical protein